MPLLQRGRPAAKWLAQPSASELAAAASFNAAFARRAATGNAASYGDDVLNALRYLGGFHGVMPSRELFQRNTSAAIARENVSLRDDLFEYIRQRGSLRPGKLHGTKLKAETISGILSTLVTFLGRLAGTPDMLGEHAMAGEFGQARKQARHEDGPAGTGSTRRDDAPIRGQHFDSAYGARNAFPLERSSVPGKIRHAVGLFGHNTVARGADMGHPSQGLPIDPERDLTIDAFDLEAGASVDPPMLVAWMHPSKDASQTLPRYPMVVQRRNKRADCAFGADPLCAFDAVMSVWDILATSVPREEWGATMFFRAYDIAAHPRNWRPLTTADVAIFCKEIGTAAGIDVSNVGGKALRMGGATDIYDIWGLQSQQWLRERGRWSKDMGQIYAGVSATAHGNISMCIADSKGRDLQSMFSGWRQPARITARS